MLSLIGAVYHQAKISYLKEIFVDKTFQATAEYYQQLAHRSVRSGNFLGARMAYYRSIQAWEKTVESHPSLINYLIAVQKEYKRFVQTDSEYRLLLNEVKMLIEERPGIRQTDLYRELTKYHHTDLEYLLYFAAKDGEILRTESDNDFQLSPVHKEKTGLKGILSKLIGHTVVRV